MNYTELEAKTREATNNEPWGCPSTLMHELARATFTTSELEQVLGMILQRLAEPKPTQWRPTYKGFLLLEFLLKNGSDQVKDYLLFHEAFLASFSSSSYEVSDENEKPQGVNIRTRAAAVLELLQNGQLLARERQTARENQGKYKGHGNHGHTPQWEDSHDSQWEDFYPTSSHRTFDNSSRPVSPPGPPVNSYRSTARTPEEQPASCPPEPSLINFD